MINTKRNKLVGLQGWKCEKFNINASFDYCLLQCPEPCLPMPVLLALSRNRGVEEGVYGVTEILNPPQQVYLKRNNPYYSTVDSEIWMLFGSAWHKVLEDGLSMMDDDTRQEYEAEEQTAFEVDFGYAKLRGRADLWNKRTKTLRDFKTIKVYPAKKLKKGDWDDSTYHWQMNIYRRYKYPDAENMFLDCIVKDWNMNARDKDGVNPMEIIQVPFIDDAVVELRTQELLQEHVMVQNSGKFRRCQDEEIWINPNPRSTNYGVPIRCRDYCPVVDLCKQAQEWQKRNNGWVQNEKKRKPKSTKRTKEV